MAHITFQLNYHTTWGQQVCVCGSAPELGGFNESKAPVLSNQGDVWSLHIEVEETPAMEYYYFIKEGDVTVRREWGKHRRIVVEKDKSFIIHDLWKSQPYHSYLYSSLFTENIFAHAKEALPKKYPSKSILLNVICPYVKKGQSLVISGENEALGKWDIQKALPLSHIDDGEWQIVLNAEKFPDETFYKFVIIDNATRQPVHWEDGGNRVLFARNVKEKNTVFAEMGLVYHYYNFSYKGAGTAIPVFSLRSEKSFGIGDFSDLKKMIDWAALTHQQLLQVLPINDTTTSRTWKDSYPYSAISIYALHPIYLGCSDFPLKDEKKMARYLQTAKKLNKLPQLDYESVLKLKDAYCKELFLQDGETVLTSDDFGAFFEKNKTWLTPYAFYCYLRDKNETADFKAWGEYSVYNEERLSTLVAGTPEAKKIVDFYYFIQYLLHKQLLGVKEYGQTKGVALKGDIPIGINRDSIDAWTAPELFNMDTQTGAPPDDFSVYGQNWGFPTYNWGAMERDGYEWWIHRFQKMADYFDAYRIDHILGFFRIWEIPLAAVQGLLGYFSPALPYWAEELMQAGIPFDEERMVQPFIHEHFLENYFGEYVEEVKETYLEVSGWQRFKLKSFCDTQRKIIDLLGGKSDDKSKQLHDGLMALCANVLFVRDKQDPHRFHPRITAQYTDSYRYLDDHVKHAFNRLYDDFFYRRHNYFWREQAMKKLPTLISSTSMLVCGEDLGMVPDCVPSVMNELKILSLEIQRMPKDPHAQFTDLHHVPYLSVCTTSTHDMSPIRLWWTENKEITQQYYNHVLQLEGEAPLECNPSLCEKILQNHLQSNAMWVVLPWQDWLSIDGKLRNPDPESERINIPANPNHYWRYRMHLTLEELLKAESFNEKVREMSGR